MNITDKSALRECTSCQLCAAVCPKGAISIALNDDGFYRPIVDNDICIDCNICTKVCYKFDSNIKISSSEDLEHEPLFSAWSKDDELVRSTTSGGIGDLLARQLIEEGYKVVGVCYNDDKTRAEHAIATNINETLPFRGSKYIQSYTLDAMKTVVKQCRSEKYAVFGTPCQIYALSKLAEMRKVRDNFFFVDLYCHGCPSLHVWTKYQSYIKKKLDIEHFDRVDFRSKVKGWGGFYVVVVVVDGKPVFTSNPREDGFYELFFSDQVLNDGCHDCKLRGTLEYTDIRLGDFWGKKYLSNHRGVSAVSLVTERAVGLFDKIKRDIDCKQCSYAEFLPYQSWGKEYAPKMPARMAVLDSLKDCNQNIEDAVKAFRKHQSFKGKLKRCVKGCLYYFPLSVTMFLKRFL